VLLILLTSTGFCLFEARTRDILTVTGRHLGCSDGTYISSFPLAAKAAVFSSCHWGCHWGCHRHCYRHCHWHCHYRCHWHYHPLSLQLSSPLNLWPSLTSSSLDIIFHLAPGEFSRPVCLKRESCKESSGRLEKLDAVARAQLKCPSDAASIKSRSDKNGAVEDIPHRKQVLSRSASL
jgi:hypothetical protein